MHRNGRALLIFILLLICTANRAVAVQGVASCAAFHRGGLTGHDSAVLELYWRMDAQSLHYHRTDAGLTQAEVKGAILIKDSTGRVLADDHFAASLTKDEAGGLQIRRYVLPNAAFTLTLVLSEAGFSAAAFTYTEEVNAAMPVLPAYSSLQLLDTFFTSSAASPFLKSGRQQMPSPINFLNDRQHTLIGYFELYGTASLPAAAFPLVQQTFISPKNSSDAIIGQKLYDTIYTASAVHPFLHSFHTAALPSGNYYLRATLQDKAGNILTEASTFYQTVNKHPVAASGKADTGSVSNDSPEHIAVFDLNKTFVAKYTPAQLKAMLKMISPIATPDERIAINGFLRKPDEMYMRYFLFNFFQGRSADKDAAAAWKHYSDTVRQVNKQFSSGSTMGYETDRGIVFLKYGEPVEKITVPNEAGALPYELWRYVKNGRYNDEGIFLFYQRNAAGGAMELLHSTVPTEHKNYSWRNIIYSDGKVPVNSRAEEMIGNR